MGNDERKECPIPGQPAHWVTAKVVVPVWLRSPTSSPREEVRKAGAEPIAKGPEEGMDNSPQAPAKPRSGANHVVLPSSRSSWTASGLRWVGREERADWPGGVAAEPQPACCAERGAGARTSPGCPGQEGPNGPTYLVLPRVAPLHLAVCV